jgi:hypothetical protein
VAAELAAVAAAIAAARLEWNSTGAVQGTAAAAIEAAGNCCQQIALHLRAAQLATKLLSR